MYGRPPDPVAIARPPDPAPFPTLADLLDRYAAADHTRRVTALVGRTLAHARAYRDGTLDDADLEIVTRALAERFFAESRTVAAEIVSAALDAAQGQREEADDAA